MATNEEWKEPGPLFQLEFKVRDYECDLQGIVNNAQYLHYLEHTRHEFLKSKGLDFAQLHAEGKDAVVSRLEIDYKASLTSGDEFIVTLNLAAEGRLRMIFQQKIFHKSDQRLLAQAKVTAALIQNRRPIPVDDFLKVILI